MIEQQPPPEYKINPWKVEFASAETETRYRGHTANTSARYLIRVLYGWILLVATFSYVDYFYNGFGRAFLLSVAGRALVIVIMVLSIYALNKRPSWAANGAAITPLLLFCVMLYPGLYFITPDEWTAWIAAIAMILIVIQYVQVPNRFLYSLAIGLLSAVLNLACLYAVSRPGLTHMLSLLLAFGLPVYAGSTISYRLHMLHRREFEALERAQKENERRKQLEATLKRQAETDPLTGLYNRRRYEELFEQAMAVARATGQPLAVCIIDLDHFKYINDTYGHAAGDLALSHIATVCRRELRESDIVGRLGGEEFLVVLPATSAEDAATVLNRLRTKIEADIIEAAEQSFQLTATFGVTELQPGDKALSDLLVRADKALYRGKHRGRNQVFAYDTRGGKETTTEARKTTT
ncbi:hypothetical protein CAI21_10305 [Alkalilimnicola ehrlichii]|uniref:diguanylate cyclase n=1 Tax=Alkalilimnicola ehrlichii TaxID=351052 RepID=A0A3E0WVN9_9GAMM|nr:GGDEF domain-containing protein [Alkalilimnicola ehrlichii]RFA29153.1 hypothetical protein CAI21_10305 [Alkalilimnicola ehrlichii]RFA36065.1 hypothetical protein CAL65_11455 [Alkalilimnicola ehrlichii]